jgi:transcriptional regulator with XRE-family HTH domain
MLNVLMRTRRAEEQSMSQVVMSTGQAARELGVSQSLLRKLELIGVAPRAQRIAGLDRRLYSTQEVEELRQIIADRRASQSPEPEAA